MESLKLKKAGACAPELTLHIVNFILSTIVSFNGTFQCYSHIRWWFMTIDWALWHLAENIILQMVVYWVQLKRFHSEKKTLSRRDDHTLDMLKKIHSKIVNMSISFIKNVCIMNFDSYKQLILDRLRSICERIKENPLANLLKHGDLTV